MGIWLEGKPLADKVRDRVAREVARIKEVKGTVPGPGGRARGRQRRFPKLRPDEGEGLPGPGPLVRGPAPARRHVAERLQGPHRRAQRGGSCGRHPRPAAPSPPLDSHEAISWLRPDKDVDGFHPYNLGLLMENRPGPRPCTPTGIVELIKSTGVTLEGAEAAVVGRSMIVGKPLAAMMINENATVTICHSRTRDLARVTSRADILISAIGRPGFLGPEHVKEGAVVVDVGSNAVSDPAVIRNIFGADPKREQDVREKGYTWAGDVHPRAIDKAGWLTPSPGGVGPRRSPTLTKKKKARWRPISLRRG